jgi:D-beta-D-heptose 7-phosphate kinase/D-beta-D-heptose 1-phosphate adenosyltransferase
MKKNIKVAVTGHFDPLHIGHVQHIQEAARLGDMLIVILSGSEQCIKKKGYEFMPYQERAGILLALKDVNLVVPNIDVDNTTTESLRTYKPDIFAKGGDRTPDNMPQSELDICKKLGIEIVYNVGGSKIQSSSKLVKDSKVKLG